MAVQRLILLAAFAGAAFGAMAQGTLQFQNSFSTPIRIARGTGTDYAVASDNLVVAFFWGSSGSNVVNLGGTAAITTSTQGVFAGSTVWPVVGTNPTDEIFVQVAVWDMSYGTTLVGMQACVSDGGEWAAPTSPYNPPTSFAGYGQFGAPLPFTLGPTSGPGTVIFTSTGIPGFFKSVTIYPVVPEPASVAILGLGFAALVLSRRWRRQ